MLEKGVPGIGLWRMKTQGWWASNTTFAELDSVRAPVENLIGKEGEGFKYTIINFNHERMLMVTQATRFSRFMLEDSIAFARLRKTFGKNLIQHQMIRHKIANLAYRIEGVHRSIEN